MRSRCENKDDCCFVATHTYTRIHLADEKGKAADEVEEGGNDDAFLHTNLDSFQAYSELTIKLSLFRSVSIYSSECEQVYVCVLYPVRLCICICVCIYISLCARERTDAENLNSRRDRSKTSC